MFEGFRTEYHVKMLPAPSLCPRWDLDYQERYTYCCCGVSSVGDFNGMLNLELDFTRLGTLHTMGVKPKGLNPKSMVLKPEGHKDHKKDTKSEAKESSLVRGQFHSGRLKKLTCLLKVAFC